MEEDTRIPKITDEQRAIISYTREWINAELEILAANIEDFAFDVVNDEFVTDLADKRFDLHAAILSVAYNEAGKFTLELLDMANAFAMAAEENGQIEWEVPVD